MMTKESPCHMLSKFHGSQLVVLEVGLYGSSIITGRQISEIMDNICFKYMLFITTILSNKNTYIIIIALPYNTPLSAGFSSSPSCTLSANK